VEEPHYRGAYVEGNLMACRNECQDVDDTRDEVGRDELLRLVLQVLK
jgi:hypothetical protein